MKAEDTDNIAIANEQAFLSAAEDDLRRTISYVLERYDKGEARVSLALIDSPRMRSLKNRYFKIDEVTDVISFNLNESPSDPLECEVVVNAQLAAERAAEYGQDAHTELSLYVVHGLLHQLGFDDGSEAAAKAMHSVEDHLLEELGFGQVYRRKEE